MRSPLDHTRSTPNGAYLAKRQAPRFCRFASSGSCVHYGIDLGGKAGTPVVAPEAGVVVVSRPVAVDGRDPPFSGFGPGVVLLRGDSGVWHLLGHVRPSSLVYDLAPADQSKAGLLAAWGGGAGGVRVQEGDELAQLAGLHQDARGRYTNGHVHWEVRPGPLAGKASTYDPLRWLASWQQAGRAPAPGAPRGPAHETSWGWLVAVALLAYAAR